MNHLLSQLNEPQQQAVQTTEGPLLIIAGAGSGKTKALTYRIAYLIREKQVGAKNILAVTFTNKAANEMKERIKHLLSENNPYAAEPIVGTFHSVCVRLLRREAQNLGYENNFVIYDTADSEALMKRILKENHYDEKQYTPKTVLAHISRAKNNLIDEKSYPAKVNSYFEEQVAMLYPLYQKALKKCQAFDFDDLIFRTIELFWKFPEILDKYQEQFRYICIDEYQDTNLAQYTFSQLLAQKYRNICVIGDDWQSIYSWRGADMTNILNFQKDYPEAVIIKLEQNYRSTKVIVEAANHVIKNNSRRTDKTLWTDKESSEKIVLVEAYDERDEGERVIGIMEELIRRSREESGQPDESRIMNQESRDTGSLPIATSKLGGLFESMNEDSRDNPPVSAFSKVVGGFVEATSIQSSSDNISESNHQSSIVNHKFPLSFTDFAILYRTNAQSRIMEESFLRHGIAYKIVGGVSFYQRKEIKDVVAYLKTIHNPSDTISLLRILNTPPRNIGPSTVEVLTNYALKFDVTLYEALHRASEMLELSPRTKNSVGAFYEFLIDTRKKIHEFPVGSMIKYLLQTSGYKDFLLDGTAEGEERWENVQELVSVASKYDQLEPAISLATFLEEVSLVAQVDVLDDKKEEGVVLMTLHNAKGLEFPYVFIVGLEEGVFPHSQSQWTQEELEEERRLMYVGITRAKEKLFLLYAKSRMLYGNYQNNLPSRFIYEIPEQYMEGIEPQKKGGYKTYDSKPEPENRPVFDFHDGEKVLHKSWGEGIIVQIKGDVATIAFKDPKIGIKKMALNIAPLEKI